ncbi:MAG: RluA family pseudouridine synthase [Methylobacteriaceae bacterium]|nr:RluA family pseudouridine synthase [Methylobacteriaceae bacterium]MBV9394947.1 RluA family pseudouridine synthase [Methylobacteriaceae bacterium]
MTSGAFLLREPSFSEPPGEAHEFALRAEEDGLRLDRVLASRSEAEALGLSRTRLQQLIRGGHVEIDGAVLRDPGTRAKAGARVRIIVPPPQKLDVAGEDIPLSIIFEDKHLIVVDKPAGLVVHPGAGNRSGTLVNALLAHCGAELSGIGGVERPGIVHRLDKDTSGLLVVAKTDAAHRGLARLFADHGRTLPFLREYYALIWGAPDRAAGIVDAPLGRASADREKMAVIAAERGRAARTHWRVLERYGPAGRGVVSFVACRLETGRTHQIRVHMAHIGHPIVGDPVYATGFKSKAAQLPDAARDAVSHLRRQALHAAVLAFDHPITGEALRFESPWPQDLRPAREALAGWR